MRRSGNQANITLRLAATVEVFSNRQQASVFTLGAGVGLHTDGIKTGDLFQHMLQLLDHFLIALHLVNWRKGMWFGKLWPRHWNHFGSCIQFHGA